MFDHLLESSRWDDFNKMSNKWFGEENGVIEMKYAPYLGPCNRAPDKLRIFIFKTSIAWPNPMFDHFLESSHQDDSNKWSNVGFCQEIDVSEMKIRTLSGALLASLFCF